MNTCTQCKEEFEAKRADARYCSSTCRKRSSRVTDNDVTLKTPNATDNATLTNTLKPIKTYPAMYDVCSPTSTQEERDVLSRVLDHYIDSYTP